MKYYLEFLRGYSGIWLNYWADDRCLSADEANRQLAHCQKLFPLVTFRVVPVEE